MFNSKIAEKTQEQFDKAVAGGKKIYSEAAEKYGFKMPEGYEQKGNTWVLKKQDDPAKPQPQEQEASTETPQAPEASGMPELSEEDAALLAKMQADMEEIDWIDEDLLPMSTQAIGAVDKSAIESFVKENEWSPRYSTTESKVSLPESNTEEVNGIVADYFGGAIPANMSVVHDTEAKFDAVIVGDRIELNSAYLNPKDVAFKIEHEIGHHLYRDPAFQKHFDTLWVALGKDRQDEITAIVGSLYKGEGTEIQQEERRVRALEAIRRMAAEGTLPQEQKTAWQAFVDYLSEAWRKLTWQMPNPDFWFLETLFFTQ